MDIGSAVSRREGVSEGQILELSSYETSALFSGTERLVLAYADAMTQSPVEIPDELFAKLRAEFSDQALVELTSTIAWENYRARFDHALGIESEGFTEGAVCVLPAQRR
jgi:4-carboxymuconolactone decarboxylase